MSRSKYKRIQIDDLWPGDVIYIKSNSCLGYSGPGQVFSVQDCDGRTYVEFMPIPSQGKWHPLFDTDNQSTIHVGKSVLALRRPVKLPQPDFSVDL